MCSLLDPKLKDWIANSILFALDPKVEEKIAEELRRFDEALVQGTFDLNRESEFLQSQSQFLAEDGADKHSVVCDFLDALQGVVGHQTSGSSPDGATRLVHENSDFTDMAGEGGTEAGVEDFKDLNVTDHSQVLN